ncbi:MAG TPA: SUMF1/EgtB/PvdO family nonheme iron enzyme [Thermoanaerobaculia bacterium]|nr:SUMF1/EgtB/PvdO family nonheme iron enzyme [Thermoanaerobaculia bacterium]
MIFVSYSHEPESHRRRVEELVATLRSAGLDIVFDGDVVTPQGPPEWWHHWMLNRIKAAWVLVVCNRTYYERFSNPGEEGKGTRFESTIITQAIYDQSMVNDRFIPVLFEDASPEDIPEPLRGATRYRIPDDLETLTTRLGAAVIPEQRRVSDPLEGYLQQTAADHNRLVPHFQQLANLDLLDRVYVRQEILAEASVAWGRPLGIRDVLVQPAKEYPWITGKWMVLGDPGAGKTTLLRSLAAELARDPSAPWIPVIDSLPRLLRKREWILDRVVRRLHLAGFRDAEATGRALDAAGEQGRLLVLLDGLDEVAKEDREDAASLLQGLVTHWPRTPIVVTSRPIGYHRPHGDFREVELLPLTPTHRHEFLARWFGRGRGVLEGERATQALAVLEEDPNLWELSGNPLYLTLMALLLEQGSTLRTNRSELYRQVFDLLLRGKHKTEPQPLELPRAVLGALQYLAFALTRENRDADTQDALAARLYEPQADPWRQPLERLPRWSDGLLPFLDDVASRTGILGPHDGYESDWRFWHRTFREALAAQELHRRWTVGGAEAILACAREVSGEESRWAEPYALLAGSVKEPDALVRALINENRALGVRALATAQGLKKETIAEVLQLTTEDVEGRGDVMLRIPQLLGDGERALLLLDRLRRDTTNGNDLFFLTLAVQRVARLFPDFSRRAEELLARFYDHLYQPPESLFREVVTALDGTVKLWAEIQPGWFWMGADAGEDSEQPRHFVQCAHRFAISVVPVTNEQYAAFDPAKPFAPDLARHPRVGVNWYEAVSFCHWLARCFPWTKGARLPLEEEWEYAARAGTESRFWSGDENADLARVGWYRGNSDDRTHAVGEKPASPWNLYDVHGNVAEWVLNPPRDYPQPPVRSASWESRRSDFVLRGGCYWDTPHRCRAAWRFVREQGHGLEVDSFRVVIPSEGDGCARESPLL